MLALVADTPTHDSIYVSLIGGLGLVLVALIPLLWANRGNRKSIRDTQDSVQDVRDHLPPNGRRLYQMVETTNSTVQEMQTQLNKVEAIILTHLEAHIEGRG